MRLEFKKMAKLNYVLSTKYIKHNATDRSKDGKRYICSPSKETQSGYNNKADFRIRITTKDNGPSLVAQRLKRLPAMQETWVRSLGREDPLEERKATHSSILAWRIPWSLVGYSPRGRKESDMTEQLHFHFHQG